MLICFKCRGQDGVHDVFCPYIPDDKIVREFQERNEDLFVHESDNLTWPIGGQPVPIKHQVRTSSFREMLSDWGITP